MGYPSKFRSVCPSAVRCSPLERALNRNVDCACNLKAGCGPGTLLKDDTARKCQEAIHAVDTSRSITGNMYSMQGQAVSPGTPISKMLDVMGMSHQTGAALETWHAAEPDKLVVMTECCSCETQRGEDADLMAFRASTAAPFVYNSNENSACTATLSLIFAPFLAHFFSSMPPHTRRVTYSKMTQSYP